jgi:hypothetical protein
MCSTSLHPARRNRSNPTGRINAWKKILNTLTIHYRDRIAPSNQP